MKKLVALLFAICLFATACNWRFAQYISPQQPVRWTCGPIAYRINPYNSNQWQVNDIIRVMGDLSNKTGRFIYFAGYTNETRRTAGPANGYILIEYYWPSDAPYGFGWTGRTTKNNKYTGANIYMNSPWQIHKYVFMHEAAHAIGLDHVSDPQEIMDPSRIWQNKTWGPGTELGLKELGKC